MLHVVFTTPSRLQQRLLLFLVYYLVYILGPQTLVRYVLPGVAERLDYGDELEAMEGELKDAARPEESLLHKWASFLISLQPYDRILS